MPHLQSSHPLGEGIYTGGRVKGGWGAFSTSDGKIVVMSMDGKHVVTIHRPNKAFYAMALEFISLPPYPFREKYGAIVAGDTEGVISAYSVESGEPVAEFPNMMHIGAIVLLQEMPMSLQHNPGIELASADKSGRIALWTFQSGAPRVVYLLTGHSMSVKHLEYLPSRSRLVSGSNDGSVRLWNPVYGQFGMTLKPTDGAVQTRSHKDRNGKTHTYAETVSAMQCLQDGRILFGGVGGYIRVCDSNSGKFIKSWQAHFDGHLVVGPVLNNILIHPSGDSFVTTGTDGRIRLWDVSTYENIGTIKPFEHSVLHAVWYGDSLICSGKDGSPENACGDCVRFISWDLTSSKISGEGFGSYEDVIPPCQTNTGLWVHEKRIVVAASRRGTQVIEQWTIAADD